MEMTLAQARSLAEQALIQRGMAANDAQTIVDHLLDAELCGRTPHGLIRLPRILKEYTSSNPRDIAICRESAVSALLDGGNQNGILVAQRAMDVAIKKGLSSGIGIVGGFNCTGIGIAGYYARQALPLHLIGFVTANSNARVAPYGSRQRILGTNPLAIAIPAEQDEIVADAASSKLTYGDIILAQKMGTQLSQPGLIDKDGYPTTNPWDLESGAILPIGGPKGSALGVALEVIAGPLVAAKAGLRAVSGSWGFLVGTMNPDLFVPIQEFERQVQALIDEIHQSPTAPGFSEVLIPGEHSRRKRDANLQKDALTIPDAVLREITASQL